MWQLLIYQEDCEFSPAAATLSVDKGGSRRGGVMDNLEYSYFPAFKQIAKVSNSLIPLKKDPYSAARALPKPSRLPGVP